jgi:hypothetical protein
VKYHAVAVGIVEDERPVECFGTNLAPVERWVVATAAAKKVPVRIYVTEERLIKTEWPVKEERHVEEIGTGSVGA